MSKKNKKVTASKKAVATKQVTTAKKTTVSNVVKKAVDTKALLIAKNKRQNSFLSFADSMNNAISIDSINNDLIAIAKKNKVDLSADKVTLSSRKRYVSKLAMIHAQKNTKQYASCNFADKHELARIAKSDFSLFAFLFAIMYRNTDRCIDDNCDYIVNSAKYETSADYFYYRVNSYFNYAMRQATA